MKHCLHLYLFLFCDNSGVAQLFLRVAVATPGHPGRKWRYTWYMSTVNLHFFLLFFQMTKRLMLWRWNISRTSRAWWTPANRWPSRFVQTPMTLAWSVSTSPFTSNSTTTLHALPTAILKRSRLTRRSGKRPCRHDWVPHPKPQKEKPPYLPPQSLPHLRLSPLLQHTHPTTSNPNHPALRVQTVKTQTSVRHTTSWSGKDAMTYAPDFWPYGMRSQAWLTVQRHLKLWSWPRPQNTCVRFMSETNRKPRRRSSWKTGNRSYCGDSLNWNVHKSS